MSAVALARMVIEVLQAHQRYFKSRNREDLIASKQLEVNLLKIRNAVIDADAPAPTCDLCGGCGVYNMSRSAFVDDCMPCPRCRKPLTPTIQVIVCGLCNGAGYAGVVPPRVPCPRCKGTGQEP